MSRDYGNTYWYLTAVEMCGVGGMMAGGVLCIAWGIKSRNNTLFTGVCVFHGRCHAITMDHSGSGIALIFISSCFFSHRFFVFTHTIFEVVGVNKKQKERQSRQKSLEKFNSITQKVKPENQNQTHNVRSEAVEPKNRQV